MATLSHVVGNTIPVVGNIIQPYTTLRLDKNGDGSIDYNEFADELGIHITHISNKGPLTTVMKSDYTPIHERGYVTDTDTTDLHS